MYRRDFLASATALAATSLCAGFGQSQSSDEGFPSSEIGDLTFIEKDPVPQYHHAPGSAYEAFKI